MMHDILLDTIVPLAATSATTGETFSNNRQNSNTTSHHTQQQQQATPNLFDYSYEDGQDVNVDDIVDCFTNAEALQVFEEFAFGAPPAPPPVPPPAAILPRTVESSTSEPLALPAAPPPLPSSLSSIYPLPLPATSSTSTGTTAGPTNELAPEPEPLPIEPIPITATSDIFENTLRRQTNNNFAPSSSAPSNGNGNGSNIRFGKIPTRTSSLVSISPSPEQSNSLHDSAAAGVAAACCATISDADSFCYEQYRGATMDSGIQPPYPPSDEGNDGKKLSAKGGSKSSSSASKKKKSPTKGAASVSDGHRFKPFHEEKWEQRLAELRHFRQQYGHTLVPHTFEPNPQLARWVKRQRRQYKLLHSGKTSTMTSERVAILEDVGFVWDSHEVSWREKVQELMEFRQRYGNCLVPSSYRDNPQLATWVKCQRRQYKLYWDGKPSGMNPRRIQELEAVGFCWEIRPNEGAAAVAATSSSSSADSPSKGGDGKAKKGKKTSAKRSSSLNLLGQAASML